MNSLPLFIVGTIITWTLSFPVGVRSAIYRGGVYDRSATFLAYLLISIPGFFFAYVLIIFVVTRFHVPVIGMETFGLEAETTLRFALDRVWHLLIPSILGATGGIAVLSRYVRSQMLEVVGQDYIRTAKAKGLSQFIVIFKHALRNALIPVVTTIGLQFGVLMCGAILTETIFAWPGVGKWMYDAVMQRDYMVIRSGTLFIATIFILINLCVDVLYAVINPRISVK